jgi:hypothetical protein
MLSFPGHYAEIFDKMQWNEVFRQNSDELINATMVVEQ